MHETSVYCVSLVLQHTGLSTSGTFSFCVLRGCCHLIVQCRLQVAVAKSKTTLENCGFQKLF